MSTKQSLKQLLAIDYTDYPKFLPNPPLLTSFQSGWSNIQLNHNRHSSVDVPEMSMAQHVIIIPLGHGTVDLELSLEGRKQSVLYREKDFTSCIEIFPAHLAWGVRSKASCKNNLSNFLASAAIEQSL